MKQLDLFAGIGGISLAAHWAGIETVAFCEKEPFAQEVLRRRFPGRPIYEDVFHLTREVLENDGITDIDIIAGGFPCQPFSHAGKRQGTGDDRYLWPEMHRIIGEVRPTWVFAENVDGLVSMAQSDWELVMEDETTICEEAEMVLETIRKDLENIGYRAIPIVIPACGVGASHRRYRILILAHSRCQLYKRSQQQRADEVENRQWDADKSERPGKTFPMVYSRSSRTKEYSSATKPVPSRFDTQGAHRIRTGWPTQSRLGRSPYELSDWLDGWGMNPLDALINFIASYPQPALMGQDQHDWEPPRMASSVKDRAKRLKALGNAVDPLQALPVLYGIRVLHEFLYQICKKKASWPL